VAASGAPIVQMVRLKDFAWIEMEIIWENVNGRMIKPVQLMEQEENVRAEIVAWEYVLMMLYIV
jgi:hypothetical protein